MRSAGCLGALRWSCALLAVWLAATATAATADAAAACEVELLVLGIAQDAGVPQIGHPDDPAWADPAQRRLATSLALIDHRQPARYLFEATPDLREQLTLLDRHAAVVERGSTLGLDGIFLTHAHIGHYAGLMFLGRESAGTRGVAVHAMPRMAEFLRNNGPWSQLVQLRNIELQTLADSRAVSLAADISVTPLAVPHRDEYSETVGYSIRTAGASVLFIPDIDSWEGWAVGGQTIEALVAEYDLAYLDATFFDDHELPGRDMSQIPHPRISASMDRFDVLPTEQRERIRFIHLNHTNPARFEDSPQSRQIAERGYRVAREGEVECLLDRAQGQ